MIKERPPSQGGPPHQNTGSTLPLGVNGTGCYSSAVTASTLAIEAPSNLQNYSPGTNGHHEPEKTRTDTYYRMLVESYASLDPRLKDYDVRLMVVMRTLRRKSDGLMIAGEPKLCRLTRKKNPRTPRQGLERLCKAGYYTCVRKGNGKGNASIYADGEMWNPEHADKLQDPLS